MLSKIVSKSLNNIHNCNKFERNLSARTNDQLQLSGDQNDIPHSDNFVVDI